MNKIVYNACFGGFGLSDKAYELYAKLSDITIYPEEGPFGSTYWTAPPTGDILLDNKRPSLYCYDLERHDPNLVRVVEELGEDANTAYSNLQIYETTSDLYIIEEYDGNETVVVSYDDQWIVIK